MENKEKEKTKTINYLNKFFSAELDALKLNSSDVGVSFEINLGLDIIKDDLKEKSHTMKLTVDEIEDLFEDYRKKNTENHHENK